MQYVQHVATIARDTSTVEELKVHIGQEVRHALTLAEQVAFLGGTPDTTVGAVPSRRLHAAPRRPRARGAPTRALPDPVAQANDGGLPDVAEALRPLLTQTQEHVRDLKALGE